MHLYVLDVCYSQADLSGRAPVKQEPLVVYNNQFLKLLVEALPCVAMMVRTSILHFTRRI